jgi:hypothetical protein
VGSASSDELAPHLVENHNDESLREPKMQITFTGADGRDITVSDPRREPGKSANIAPSQARRPTNWILISWKFLTMKV